MVGGAVFFLGVGVGFLLACLGMIKRLWELVAARGRRRGGAYCTRFGIGPGKMRERIYCAKHDIILFFAFISSCYVQLCLASSFTLPCYEGSLFPIP